MTYKFTRQAEADLDGLTEYTREHAGLETADRVNTRLLSIVEALARGDFMGPLAKMRSRSRPVYRWPVPPYWIYYDYVHGVLRVLRIYHGARRPL